MEAGKTENENENGNENENENENEDLRSQRLKNRIQRLHRSADRRGRGKNPRFGGITVFTA